MSRWYRLIPVCISLLLPAVALGIEWVDFSEYVAGASTQAGLHSADGLELTVTFTDMSEMRSGYPKGDSCNIDDTRWPFPETSVSRVTVIPPYGMLTTDILFVFTNPGGLPPGGSIAILDLENSGSTVTIRGFSNGTEVDVGWTVTFYQTEEAPVRDAIWDPATNTLRGGGEGHSTCNNFTFLVSDAELDSIVMTVVDDAEGISFGASATTIPDPGEIHQVHGMQGVCFEFLVTNPDSIEMIDAISIVDPRAIPTDASPPDYTVELMGCRISDSTPIELPPPAPERWCRTLGTVEGWWFFEEVAPGETGPPMAVCFSVPAAIGPDSGGCPAAWFEIDYQLLSNGVVVTNGTARFYCGPGQTAGVAEDPEGPIHQISLGYLDPTFPNPFNPVTTLQYHVKRRATVELAVYDVHGRLVKGLVSGIKEPGTYRAHWDGTDQRDRRVAPGTYFGVVEIDGKQEARKMVLVD